jgi:hypothetical protein
MLLLQAINLNPAIECQAELTDMLVRIQKLLLTKPPHVDPELRGSSAQASEWRISWRGVR